MVCYARQPRLLSACSCWYLGQGMPLWGLRIRRYLMSNLPWVPCQNGRWEGVQEAT